MESTCMKTSISHKIFQMRNPRIMLSHTFPMEFQDDPLGKSHHSVHHYGMIATHLRKSDRSLISMSMLSGFYVLWRDLSSEIKLGISARICSVDGCEILIPG